MYLQINHLNKSYGSKQVVSDVNLTMQEGELLSLLGPSGCGKTTILRMIAGLITPDGGSITVGPRVFYDGKRELAIEDRQIGMVFQDYALWPHMTIAKNIAFGMQLRHQSASTIAKRVRELLALVNLPDVGERYPYQLSGGQQQRVAVARALATEPRLVLLDEPLSSLDAGLRETMRTELVQLFQQLKITAINVTHDQDEAMSMSDRIMVLRDGKVQQIGTPTDLYLHPASAFVASFIGHANMLLGDIINTNIGTNVNGETDREALAQAEMISLRLDTGEKDPYVVTGMVNDHTRDHLHKAKANLVFRPEDIRVHQQAPQVEHSNVFEGNVLHTSFVGGQWRTFIVLDKVSASQVLAFPPFQPQPGQHLWLEVAFERCQVVPQ